MRAMLAGVSSGCGKTTVTLALLRALRDRGMRVAPFKSGPDYIDPGFHRAACGRVSHNLDEWLCSPEAVRRILQIGARDADLAIIEGAMGLYDGMGSDARCSAWSLAKLTGTPVILVVDVSGSAESAAATALGFLKYRPDSRIAGVFVNRVSGEHHYDLVREAMARIGLPCVGWMPRDGALHMPDRHLGLVTAEERGDLEAQIRRAAGELRVDWDTLTAIARAAAPVEGPPVELPPLFAGRRVGLAKDAAFSFLYAANRIALREMGAEIVEFSPLRDLQLPGGLDALYLPGGFPEVFEEELCANAPMARSVKDAVVGGLRTYAECGGMLYLAMIGAIPARWRMTDRLQRFGYVTVTDWDGERFPAHEFHYSVIESDLPRRFAVEKRGKTWAGGIVYRNTLSGYPHLHFFERPSLARKLFL